MSSNFLKVVFDDDIDMVTDPIGAMFKLSKSKEEYHTYIQQKSDRMDEDEPDNSSGSIKLEYKTQSQNHQVSKTAESTPTRGNNMSRLQTLSSTYLVVKACSIFNSTTIQMQPLTLILGIETSMQFCCIVS